MDDVKSLRRPSMVATAADLDRGRQVANTQAGELEKSLRHGFANNEGPVTYRLDDSPAADEIRSALSALRREFELDRDLSQPIKEFSAFQARLDQLTYAADVAVQLPTK